MFKIEEGYAQNKEKYGGESTEILSLVPDGARVLDMGCSTGVLARHLSGQKGCRVVGVDVDEGSLREAARYCEKVLCCDLDDVQDLRKLLAGESFDAMTFGDILEHLKDPGVLLNTLRDFLKPGGCIVASIPNAAFLSMRLKFLLGDFSYQSNGGLMDVDHLRFFSFKTVRLLFEVSGYSIQKIYGVSIVKKRFWFLKPLAKIAPSLFALHIMVLARR